MQLRRGVGVLLAVAWNLPLVLLFWWGWRTVLRVISAQCFVWALWLYLAASSPRWRSLLVRPDAEDTGAAPRYRGASVLMIVYGVVALVASFFETR
jgi:hypothetical protein